MKKHFIICLIVTFAIALPIFCCVSTKNSSQARASNNTKAENYEYILSDYNGYIALFKVNYAEPVEVYNILTDSLPLNDAKDIKNGIYAHSVDELTLIIEEYTS